MYITTEVVTTIKEGDTTRFFAQDKDIHDN